MRLKRLNRFIQGSIQSLHRFKRFSVNSIAAAQIHFFLAQGVLMQGRVTVPGLAVIEGHFKGELSADTVIVKAGGVIEGTVRADSLLVQGRIIGDTTSGQYPEISIHAAPVSAAMPAPAPALPPQRVPAAPAVPVLRMASPGWQTRVLGQPMTRAVGPGWPAQIRLGPPQARRVHRTPRGAAAHRTVPQAAKTQEMLH
jgi:hypothetical protein